MIYVRNNPLEASTDLVSYLDKLVEWLFHHESVAGRKGWRGDFGVGQLALFCAASYVVLPSGGCHLSGHFSRLPDKKPFDLWTGGPYKYFPLMGEGGKEWRCFSIFPTPEEDALLHLCLTGGKGFSAFKDSGSFRVIFWEAGRENCSFLDSRPIGVGDSMSLEVMVAGAIAVASHYNGLAGLTFSDFFSALLFELGMQNSEDISVKFPKDLAAILSDLPVPFLAPPNVKWPDFLLQTSLNLGTVSRLRFRDKGDIEFLGGKISVECLASKCSLSQARMRRALTWIPDASVIHFIVLHSLRREYFRKRGRDQNGNVVYEQFRKNLAKSLRDAHFYRLAVFQSPVNDTEGRMWRDDLEEIPGMSNELCRPLGFKSGQVSKVIIFLELCAVRGQSLKEGGETKKRRLK
ncbi:hypothetical protein PR003_g17228 [Phytophthora rubi]|uniref:Uncharacterized protein n=2 Tax=Phytophthora rubi TaxID=129364 RepID=A0A6A4EH68_9STRA|nr:hypothetical protein PR002_g21808 [Phytophthora rubi]KAE9322452.1 hypothetical protein PR003_g17228 [Phytophthora rubi]